MRKSLVVIANLMYFATDCEVGLTGRSIECCSIDIECKLLLLVADIKDKCYSLDITLDGLDKICSITELDLVHDEFLVDELFVLLTGAEEREKYFEYWNASKNGLVFPSRFCFYCFL